jgi:hypothetical protein
MNTESEKSVALEIWKPRTMLLGGLIGATIGVLAGYLILQKGENNKPPELTAVDGVKIGVLVFGLLRSIANL